jgi:inosine-uridine nucleoside N-ribohydrolase
MLISGTIDGQDGLGGIHSSAPHFTPTEQWTHLFSPEADPANTSPPMVRLPPNFKPSSRPAHIEILASLAAHPPDTIIIIALGPLTNLALAASSDPTTFLRAKEIVTMGGALMVPGNVTPVAEFNWFACPYSAARILALTSPIPESTMPACRELPPYPAASLLPRTLNITQISLDITTEHLLQLDEFNMAVGVKSDSGSPLSTWANGFLDASFKRLESIYGGGRSKDVLLALHDPLCVWYVLQGGSDAGWKVVEGCDVRVETDGQWTRGMAVVDRRKKRVADAEAAELLKHDRGGWLHRGRGNRVRIVTGSNGQEVNFGKIMVKRIFNCMQFQEEE